MKKYLYLLYITLEIMIPGILFLLIGIILMSIAAVLHVIKIKVSAFYNQYNEIIESILSEDDDERS